MTVLLSKESDDGEAEAGRYGLPQTKILATLPGRRWVRGASPSAGAAQRPKNVPHCAATPQRKKGVRPDNWQLSSFPASLQAKRHIAHRPIDNCCAIHRLLTVVSRPNRRAILTFPASPLRRRPKSASSPSTFASSSAMIRRAFPSADWPISSPNPNAVQIEALAPAVWMR